MLLQQRSENQIILSADLWVNFYGETLQRIIHLRKEDYWPLKSNQHCFKANVSNVLTLYLRKAKGILNQDSSSDMCMFYLLDA